MNKTDLPIMIEGILFAADAPVSAENLSKLLATEKKIPLGEIREAIATLHKCYQNRGVELVEVASGYRFQVTSHIAPLIAKNIEDKPSKYSRALLETLAIIAYRQPITRSEIEEIRGVVVSTQIIKTLDEHEWIRIIGHKDVPGKPALYATTKSFLDHFGLKNLEELPPLADLQEMESLIANAMQPQENEKIDIHHEVVEIEENA